MPGGVAVGADRVRNRRKDERRVAERRERDEPHAVGEGMRRLARNGEREPRLADAARPGDRHRSGSVEERLQDVGELLLAPDERVGGERKVRAVEALQRWKLAVAELVDALGRREVLEAMFAEVDEPVDSDKRSRRGGDEHLSAVADCRDARGAVHIVSDVALVGDERRPGVQADANVDRAGRQRLRERGCSRESAGRRREGEEEGVALGVDLDPALGRARLPDQPTVLRERLGVRLRAERVQEPRRALDVGEEERDGAGREVVSHAA